jgi:hypothetical protein
VPPALVPSAARGIDVNPEQCILWLDHALVPLAYELRRTGLSS